MKNIISLFIFLLSFSKINLNAIFPTIPSYQELNCTKKENPSLESCTSMETSDDQYTCCFVHGVGLSKCGYVENTQFGIKAYKHIYSEIDDLSIECKANYLRSIFISFFLILIVYI